MQTIPTLTRDQQDLTPRQREVLVLAARGDVLYRNGDDGPIAVIRGDVVVRHSASVLLEKNLVRPTPFSTYPHEGNPNGRLVVTDEGMELLRREVKKARRPVKYTLFQLPVGGVFDKR